MMEDPHASSRKNKLYNADVILYAQILILFVLIIVSIVNLSLGPPDPCVWSSILSGAIASLLGLPASTKSNSK